MIDPARMFQGEPLPCWIAAPLILAISAALWGGVIALCFGGWPA